MYEVRLFKPYVFLCWALSVCLINVHGNLVSDGLYIQYFCDYFYPFYMYYLFLHTNSLAPVLTSRQWRAGITLSRRYESLQQIWGMYVASYKAHCLPYPIYHNFKVAIEISLHPGRPLLHDLLIAFILICSCLERAYMIPFHGGKNGELFLLHVFNFSFAVVE